MAARRRRPLLVWALFALFVVVPLVEIYVIIQVGQAIGPWWTILLLVADSVLGSWLIKREGGRAFRALREAIDSGRMPAKELADGGLILVGGTLMLAPGFVTDIFGIAMILPFTRPFFRGVLTRVVASRLVVTRLGGGSRPGAARRPGPDPEGPVVRGEVVDEP
ncbi:FxsA family protein [Nocardioides anomalus]|uniref:FxsA family protein n=1 Tax=Nocardioides anomalus TaxID=2712223 RepID=A0A6G6WDD4_9ACTN|nr:FxsA family protein [Nocardioides anomalus]QIG43229.1 FxsA family protein [Nocardioides anomalus]